MSSDVVISQDEISIQNGHTTVISDNIDIGIHSVDPIVNIQAEEFVLSSGGVYGSNGLIGAVPQWILDAVQQQLTTGSGNLMQVLLDMQTLMNSMQTGVNQTITSLNTLTSSQNAITTAIASRVDLNHAEILNTMATRVTATEAQALIATGIQSTFGPDANAYIGNIASTYTDANSAVGQSLSLLSTTLNGVSASIQTTDSVVMTKALVLRQSTMPTIITNPELKNGDLWVNTADFNKTYMWNGTSWESTSNTDAKNAVTWSATAAKLITAPDGSVTGWSFGDGTGIKSYFKINATNFSISDGTNGYTPFSITGNNINFLGKVTFSSISDAASTIPTIASVNSKATLAEVAAQGYVLPAGVANAINTNTTTIDGAKITTGSIYAGQIHASEITANLLSADAINGKIINGATINGANINGAVIKASWIDLSSNGILTNWSIYTLAEAQATPYLTNYAKLPDGTYIVDILGHVRLPGTNQCYSNPSTTTYSSQPNVFASSQTFSLTMESNIRSSSSYTQSNTNRIIKNTGSQAIMSLSSSGIICSVGRNDAGAGLITSCSFSLNGLQYTTNITYTAGLNDGELYLTCSDGWTSPTTIVSGPIGDYTSYNKTFSHDGFNFIASGPVPSNDLLSYKIFTLSFAPGNHGFVLRDFTTFLGNFSLSAGSSQSFNTNSISDLYASIPLFQIF